MKSILTNNWICTNRPISCNLPVCLEVQNFFIYADKTNETFQQDILLYDGYMLPRTNSQYAAVNNEKVLGEKILRCNHTQWLKEIKGSFCGCKVSDHKIMLFNDPLNIRKIFYIETDTIVAFSNSISLLSRVTKLQISKTNIAIHCLFNHFVNYRTLYENVHYCHPASIIEIHDGTIQKNTYWSASVLTENRSSPGMTKKDFAMFFSDTIEHYLRFVSPRSIAMTLTGGADTRLILSALLHKKRRPHVFTFGNPQCYDNIIAREIAQKNALHHSNYYVADPTPEWVQNKTHQIISFGNTLINSFRAHRLDAIEQDCSLYDYNMLFTGFMGGDYIKGAPMDDYIVTDLIRRWWTEKDKKHILTEILDKNFLLYSSSTIDELHDIIVSLPFFTDHPKINEFNVVHYLIGMVHDTQDITIFNQYVPYVMHPFLDIDILIALFSTRYNMMYHHNTAKNPLKKIQGPMLSAYAINYLYPPLADIFFSRFYSPKDYLRGPLWYLTKRSLYKVISPSYPPGFPYGKWFKDYITEAIPKLYNTPLTEIFNLQKMTHTLQTLSPIPTREKDWHRFNHAVLMYKYINHF